MGLLEALLGQENPAAQWAGKNQNWLGTVGTGIANGLEFGNLGEARQMDYLGEQQKIAEAKVTAQTTASHGWLRQFHPDLAAQVDAGAPIAEIMPLAFQRMSPQAGPDPTANMREYEYALQNGFEGDFNSWVNPQNASGGDQPALLQEYEYAKGQGYQGSLLDYQQAKGRNSGTPPATIAKEIFEADEGAQAGQNVILALDRALELNKTAGDGPLADTWSAGAALFGDQQAVQTQELKNIVTANALESLKATFGAAPTEGERKILLEIQGSVNQSRPVREAIFKRAKAAAERRLKFNQERGGALRGGNYFDPGYSPIGGAPAANVDDILGKYGL